MPYSRTARIRNHMLAAWKWCLSFRKREWDLDDYPIGIAEQDVDAAYSSSRFTQYRYRAYIINWSVMGSGDTPEQAKDNLADNFKTLKRNGRQEGKRLVRPGSHGLIEFASQDKISSNEALSQDFIQRILGLEWAWISDESSLWDFHTEQTNDLLYAKIQEIYGVDVSDIESARLWAIFERIESEQSTWRQLSV